MSEQMIMRLADTPSAVAQRMVEAVEEGYIDPIEAFANLAKVELAIKKFKDNEKVRDMAIEAVMRDGKREQGDVLVEVVESGVRYDFTNCNDAELRDLYTLRSDVEARIKEKEKVLKALPIEGLADIHTGEVLYPPTKSSKTTLRTTIKNK